MRSVVGALVIVILAGCAAPAGRSVLPSEPPGSTAAEPSQSTASPVPSSPSPAPTLVASKPTPAPAGSPPATTSAAAPTLAQLIGQKLMVRITGTTPSASLLARVRAGQIGGVILFGSNVTSPAQVVSLAAELQAAARKSGQPPLVIATDQEGGTVKRIPWAAPTLSTPEMGSIGSRSTARSQGLATGQALLGLGIDCDLAPVGDVPGSAGSFMYQDGRTWSLDPAITSTLSNAFSRGLEAAGVAPAMKHFPGIGLASQNTDAFVVTITASQAQLAPGLQPYMTAIAKAMPMIMLSNATYTAYDPVNGAGWSRAIVKVLLRDQLGFQGVTITDSLSGTAKARGLPASTLAIRAAIAGTDMLLVTGSEASTQATYEALLAAARAGSIPTHRLLVSYRRILALKASL